MSAAPAPWWDFGAAKSAGLSPRHVAAIRLGLEAARAAGLGPLAQIDAVGIGWRESLLGMFGQFLRTLPDGRKVPSFNWGATTARSKEIPSFGGTDTFDGKKIAQRWAYWRNMGEGLDYWLSFPQVRRSRAALERGDEWEIARHFHDGGYFTGAEGLTREQKIAEYAAMIRGGRKQVLAVRDSSRAVAIASCGGLIVAALTVEGVRRWKRRR